MIARGRAAWAVAVVPVLALTAACGSGEPAAESSSVEDSSNPEMADELELTAGSAIVDLPESLGPNPADATAGAARTSDDMLIYVVTFGSSTCPMVAEPTAQLAGDGAVEVAFPEFGGGACTSDFVPSTTVVALPDEVDPEADLTVTIGTLGEVVLPAGSDDAVWAVAPAA